MGVHLYCLGAPDHPVPADTRGVGGEPVRAVEVAGFSAWVSDLTHRPTPSLAAVQEHHAVVARAAEQRTPLPVRFGQWFESPALLEASVAERTESLEAALRRVAGAVEFGVRIVDPQHQPRSAPDRSSGRGYLEALAQRRREEEAAARRGEALAAALTAWMGALVREHRVHPLDRDRGLASVSHLVRRHDTGGYQSRIRRYPARHPDLRFFFSGPWPPYGFAE